VEDRSVIEHFLETKSEEAFSELFRVVCMRVYRYLVLRGLDGPTAEELTQNVLFKVYRQSGELRNTEHFYGWLFAITRNEMASYWRGRKARIETVGIESLSEHYLESNALESGRIPPTRLSEWLELLEESERELVLLRFVEGLSYEELAVAFEAPIGTIKWRIFNARKKLSQIMSGLSLCSDARMVN
jgi:RNA polymerase sigma-70 factor (ECF subfamily)